jgi:hypothetical protein
MRTTNPSALVAANLQRLMASEVDQNFGQFAYELPAGATMSFYRTVTGEERG